MVTADCKGDNSAADSSDIGRRIVSGGSDKNYNTIFIANAAFSFAEGLYHPFFIAFLYGMGGISLMGAGLGLSAIFDSLGSYFVGKLADKYGRKPVFLISAVVSIAVFISYPLLPLLGKTDYRLMFFALVAILIIDGITEGAWGTVEAVYLGDVTEKATRGSRMGSYWGAGGLIFGAAMIGAGFLGVHIGFLTAAIIVSFIYLSGIFMLLRVSEL